MKKLTTNKIVCLTITLLFLMTNLVYGKSNVKKDESVYVTLNSEGTVKEQIVSDWLHSDIKTSELKDISILKNIINIKSNELPSIDGNRLDWKPTGNDIFYQGNTDKKLPISISVKYFLNGKDISPQQLIGKSGKIKIQIDIKNNTFVNANINNKNRRVATQFTTVALLNLPIDNFKNVKTSTGEVVSDGNNQIVAFVAFPGLANSLNIKQDIVKIPEGIIIEAEATKFKLGPIMAVATPELPEIKDFNEAKTINELTDGIKKLSDGGKKLEEGAAKLSEGQKLLVYNIGNLNSALLSVNKGVKTISTNQNKIIVGAKTLHTGTISLEGGIKSLSDNAKLLGQGSKQVGDGAIVLSDSTNKLISGVLKIGEGAKLLGAKTGELSDGMSKISASTEQLKQGELNLLSGINALSDGLSQLKVSQQKGNQALDMMIPGMDGLKKLAVAIGQIPNTKELTDKLISGLDQQTAGLKALRNGGDQFLEGIVKLETGINNLKEGTHKLNTGIDKLKDAQNSASDGAAKLAAAGKDIGPALEKIKAGAQAISDGADKLKDSGLKLSTGGTQFSVGGSKLVEGSKQLEKGLATLVTGSVKLNIGINSVSMGLDKIYGGSSKLLSGAKTISSGNEQLSTNMKKLNREGIDKLNNKVSAAVDKINELIGIKDKIISLSKAYKSYTGIASNMDGKVKFIFKTDEINIVNNK